MKLGTLLHDETLGRLGVLGAVFFAGMALGQYWASSAIVNSMEGVRGAIQVGFDQIVNNQNKILAGQNRAHLELRELKARSGLAVTAQPKPLMAERAVKLPTLAGTHW